MLCYYTDPVGVQGPRRVNPREINTKGCDGSVPRGHSIQKVSEYLLPTKDDPAGDGGTQRAPAWAPMSM
jgi:hypothetical protein